MIISTFFYLNYKLNDKDVQIMAKCNAGDISREEAEQLIIGSFVTEPPTQEPWIIDNSRDESGSRPCLERLLSRKY